MADEDHTARNIAIAGGVLAAAYFLLRPAQAAVVDEHGCHTLSGEVWCENTASCIVPSAGDTCIQPGGTGVEQTQTITPTECVGDGRGLIEIRAPVGSTYAGMGPWGWFTGTDANDEPNMLMVDETGSACMITDVCGYVGGQWKVRVKLPDGMTVKESPVFDFSQQGPNKNAACYYLFDVNALLAQGQSFSAAGRPLAQPYRERMRGIY